MSCTHAVQPGRRTSGTTEARARGTKQQRSRVLSCLLSCRTICLAPCQLCTHHRVSALYSSSCVSCVLIIVCQLCTHHRVSAVYSSSCVSFVLIIVCRLCTHHRVSALYSSSCVSCVLIIVCVACCSLVSSRLCMTAVCEGAAVCDALGGGAGL